jgi:antitoxin component YwqK of YwqJK toxin-antitoxin module
MKKTILLVLALTISFASINAQNAVDGKGQRKGEWFIPYTGDFKFYDYMDKLLNLDKMLLSENETEKEDEYRVFEKVSYKKGVKQGDFSVYSARKNNQGKYPQIAAGEYKDGKINGNLIFLNYGNQKRICYAVYENGKIKDQDIVIEEKVNAYEEIYETFGSQKIYPIIKMKDGICIEEIVTVLDKYKLARFVKTDKGFTRYLYGRNMLSGIIDLSHCLEVAELNNNFQFDGFVSIYEETKTPFDASLLNYKATYKNGKMNGTAYWYDAKTGNAVMECNYIDGLLNGAAKFKAASGQTYVESNYKDGLLNGKLTTFYLNDGSFLSLTGPICETKVNKNIYDIVSENANTEIFKNTIPNLRKDGPILTDGKFKFFEAQYLDGNLSGKIHYYHSDGKKLYESTVKNCKETDWYWYDTNGKILDSDKKQSLPIVYSVEIMHTIHKCHYCTKQYELKMPVKIKETSNTEGKSSIIEAGWLYANQVDNTNAINSKCNSMQNRSTKHEFEEIKTWNTTANKTESASTYQEVLDAAKTFGQIEMSLFMNCAKVSAAALLNGKK